MLNVFKKKPSPDKSVGSNKSASLSRNPSLKTTSNDTSTGTVINEFGYFQGRLESLKQLYGDIQKIGTALDQSSYTAAQDKYKILYNEIKKDPILKPEETKQLLFKIYEYQAISAFRAAKFQEHNKHLLHAYDKYSPRDESIIGLESWVKTYKNFDTDVQKVHDVFSQYSSLLKKVETEVQLLIKDKKYTDAITEMQYLSNKSNNFQIFAIHAKILIKQGDDLAAAGKKLEATKCYGNAYQYCKSKLPKDENVKYDVISDTFKELEDKLNSVGDTKLAAEAATYASKYNPNPTVATVSATPVVSPKVKKIEQELKQAQNQVEKVSNKLETAITVDVHTKQLENLKAEYEAKLAAVTAQHKTELEALKPKASPTKDTKVNEAGDFSTASSLPPPYSTIDSTVDIGDYKYLQLVKNAPTTPTAPTAPVVTSLAGEVLTELKELYNSKPEYHSDIRYIKRSQEYQKNINKAKSILNEAVKENPDVYKTIEDPKILVLLADVFLSLNQKDLGRIVCEKALKLDPNIWEATSDHIVLINLAKVLLSPEQPKAEQIYKKAIDIYIYSPDNSPNYDMTNIVSKTVAQDEYSAKEKDCLAKVCLSSPTVNKQVRALDCYPHTDVTKRQETAKQLKQLGKQQLDKQKTFLDARKAYALYSVAFPVLKNDPELLHDMKEAYASARYTTPELIPCPPTEDSTAYLIGFTIFNNDY
ncbi:hypothetical protein [Candidatus Tisiphia endosymbiont of Stenodema calcarata]|uniref:hypothetical protein n=1 Tax=Candidatus Tisiphia endosymbiont of Stenodema calcarata TaxID=3139337 RepID=UPI003CCB2105